MAMIRPLPLVLLMTVGLPACAGPGGGHGERSGGGPRGRGLPPPGMDGGRMPAPPVTTLAGRVLGTGADADCPALTAAWLAEADGTGNRDARLQQAEAQADADRLFTAIDANGDGFLTAVEIGAYRAKTAPAAHPATPDRPPPGGGQARDGYHDLARRGLPDPVMAADVGLDFKVSRAEMSDRVAARFAGLDTDGDGALTPAELAAHCPAR
ncbi:hypothetical protein L2U69_06150 [Zavarzinia compransoris]|uniref:hypothetical protein n=1 Tax=Zavarzinia marina TaxID=2911065 RepID=UPI001F435E51|nr:hypothetical protein [Zavarzinia marina]MCF4165219.1 hypothetical protein [Zavarzinia marina]